MKKRKIIKTMNNKMAKIHYLSTTELKTNEANKNRDRIMDTESVLMVTRWEGSVGGWVRR